MGNKLVVYQVDDRSKCDGHISWLRFDISFLFLLFVRARLRFCVSVCVTYIQSEYRWQCNAMDTTQTLYKNLCAAGEISLK